MNAPDPKANTTTEAYLAYKAGYLEESELKPVLYEPYLHFDAWLAYWDGLTNTYPLDKNGDPEMLTDEEALVAYLSGATDTYPEYIKDPYDVRIVGYLRHLASIRWPEPDYPVNNEEFYLSTMEPTHTSNPTPSSDIELDTASGHFLDVKIFGDTAQTQYTGKNLIDNSNTTYIWSNVADSYNTVTPIETGLRYASSFGSGNPTIIFKMFDATNLAGKVIRMRAEMGAGLYRIYRINSAGTIRDIAASTSISGYVLSYTIPDDLGDSPYIGFGLVINGATAPSVDFKNLIMTIDNDDMSYEPYTGSTATSISPSPNPDYPQDVQVVTGGQTVTVTGKNLVSPSNVHNGAFVTYDNLVNDNYTETSNTKYRTIKIENLPAGTYTLSINWDKTARWLRYVTDGGVISIGENTNTYTFTTTVDSLFGISFRNTDSSDFTDNDYTIQLYQHQDFFINLVSSKNLFNPELLPSSWSTQAMNYIDLQLEPNTTYTFSSSIPDDGSGNANLFFLDGSESPSTANNGIKNGTSRTKTTDSTGRNLRIAYRSFAQTTITRDDYTYQLESGSSSTSYTPYTPIELCKVGNYQYQDYIYKDGDDWYVHKETRKIIYTGTESWVVRAGKEHTFQVSTPSTANGGICNYFTPIRVGEFDQVNGIYLSNSNVVIVSYPAISSVADFKTWLSTHNLIVVYGLFSTSTDTKITNDELIGQLEALAGADTYDGKTYIKVTATEPNLPARFKVEAYKY